VRVGDGVSVAAGAVSVAEAASEAEGAVSAAEVAAEAALPRSLRSSKLCAPESASRPGTSPDPDRWCPQSMSECSDLLRQASWFESYFSAHSRK
jgi:hypothetical protein